MKYKGITIFKQKNYSTWYARPRINGKQIFVSAKTQIACYNKVKKLFIEQKSNNTTKIITLGNWIKDWFIIYKQELRERTKLDINYIIEKIPNKTKETNIKDISTIEIKNLIDSANGERTKQKLYTILNDIFDKAVKNNKLTTNPLANINKPKYQAKEKYVLNLEEEQKLINIAKQNKDYYIFAIAILQGLRPGELLALQNNDIDLINKTININKSIDSKTTDTKTKNKFSNRIIPIFNKTYEILKNIDTTKEERLTKENENTINEILQNITKNITKEKITLYNLRHTFITRMQDNKIPEHLIQKWCGHSKGSKITKETYTHVIEETEIKYINILNKN